MAPVKPVTKCKACGKFIVFLKTRHGRPIPCDAITVDRGETEFIKEKHRTHFQTCPEAAKFRKRKR